MKIIVVAFIIFAVFFYLKNEKTPNNLGVTNNLLAPCPNSPNCAKSQIHYSSKKHPFDKIKQILSKYPKTRIVKINDNYLHAEFRSKIFSFVDDVEFFYDQNNEVIHIRSASRVGYSDFGVNKHRIDKISADFTEAVRGDQ
ncbi:MAG: DUF1499 domain-containing protein [Chlamydiota bacterium]|nr:DUF1499 domain-containing protein [Chlamydiota bacterium]